MQVKLCPLTWRSKSRSGHASLSITVGAYMHALADNQHLITDTLSDWFGDATG